MTLSECIAMLEDVRDELEQAGIDALDVDVEVHSQKNYPLRNAIDNIRCLVEEGDGDKPRISAAMAVDQVYLKPYGSKRAWDEPHNQVRGMLEDHREGIEEDS